MRLHSFTVENYRRFVGRTTIHLHGDLIAIVGPNEAGKSSLLQALAHLDSTTAISPAERPREGATGPTVLQWRFTLDPDDLELAADLIGTRRVTSLVRTKKDGKRSYGFEPAPPRRDTGYRANLRTVLSRLDEEVMPILDWVNDTDETTTRGLLAEVTQTLEADEEVMPDPEVGALQALANRLRDLVSFEFEDPDERSLASAQERLGRLMPELANHLDEVVAVETAERIPLQRKLYDRLLERAPKIAFFGSVDRELASEYPFDDESFGAAPSALANLAGVAGLDLVALKSLHDEGNTAGVTSMINRANSVLRREFAVWTQHVAAPQFAPVSNALHVHVAVDDDQVSTIIERSDGLRWFVSLVAFIKSSSSKPILLADEIETHLHYDAQADLIDVLTGQDVAAKIIYTTHSFGCLPHDLGTGVRAVKASSATHSTVVNNFWAGSAGFSPLMTSLGAATFSFSPTRHAVIAEGPTEPILLPTLLRSAVGREMPFQIAPGLSIISAAEAGALDGEASRVAYLVDSDQGGANIRSKLLTAGIPPDRIVDLGDDGTVCTLEDLIDPVCFEDAVNREIALWHHELPKFALDADIPIRWDQVRRWCRTHDVPELSKVAVAYHVLDRSNPVQPVLDVRRAAAVQELYRRLLIALGIR